MCSYMLHACGRIVCRMRACSLVVALVVFCETCLQFIFGSFTVFGFVVETASVLLPHAPTVVPQVFIVAEYMNAGNLRMLWQRRVKRGRARLQWDTLSRLLRDAARGLRHLHASDLVHRDVKTENFLVHVGAGSGEARCVVCDFGFSRNTKTRSGGKLARAMTICGTESFMAPEVN